MGCCCGPQTDEERANKEIQGYMKNDYREQKNIHRILLLGPGDSGKSTILKQMKKIHNGNIDERERLDYVLVIRQSIVKNIVTLCQQSVRLAEKHKTDVSEKLYKEREMFLQEITLEGEDLIPNHDKIMQLWKDPGIQKTWELRALYHIPESAGFFLDQVDKVNQEKYLPTFEDYLRFRLRTSGYSKEEFVAKIDDKDVPFELIDVGGQRNERKKWMHLFKDDIKAVLYIFSVGEFDKYLFEDMTTRRLDEALSLFETVIDAKFFRNRTIVMFLNKYDLFEERLKKTPITVAFPDYPSNQDPHDLELCTKFIMDKFQLIYDEANKQLRGASTLVMHCTSALDTDLVNRLMNDIQLGLVRQMLDKVGLN